MILILFIILRNGLLYTRQKATNPRSALALFAKPADDRGVKYTVLLCVLD